MMKHFLVTTAALATLALGPVVAGAHAAGGPSVTAASTSIAADRTDLSAARKKRKAMRPAGTSKAGTGGGAGGEFRLGVGGARGPGPEPQPLSSVRCSQRKSGRARPGRLLSAE